MVAIESPSSRISPGWDVLSEFGVSESDYESLQGVDLVYLVDRLGLPICIIIVTTPAFLGAHQCSLHRAESGLRERGEAGRMGR